MHGISRRQFGGIALLAGVRARPLLGATAVDQNLQNSLRKWKIPAATAMVAAPDKIIYEGAFGLRDLHSSVRVTPESIFDIASMTKAIVTTAAMQLVEQGKMTLDEPASKHLPELEKLNVLEGFDKGGKPILRPATKAVTLRHLLSHSSGFAYDTWNENMFRYAEQTVGQAGTAYPSSLWGRAPMPLMFEPGTGWQYGSSADWTARLVEVTSGQRLDRYFDATIFGPLGMKDTGYAFSAKDFERKVTQYTREKDGSMTEIPRKLPEPPKSFFGGAGLHSTVGDYTRFMQMILRSGVGANGQRILQAKSVQDMSTNQIGKISAGKCRNHYTFTGWRDVTFHPGFTDGFTCGFLINHTAYEGGRSAGSLAWAGGWNSFYWIDPPRKLCAIIMMQFQPFYDTAAAEVLNDFEKAVYRNEAALR
jgi:CubicO group peptidase (beta-lactamase class C family)